MHVRVIDNGEEVYNSENKALGIGSWYYEDVIDLLEGLKFTFHNPGRIAKFLSIWEGKNPFDSERNNDWLVAQMYLIAAYLKFWKNGFEESISGIQIIQNGVGAFSVQIQHRNSLW